MPAFKFPCSVCEKDTDSTYCTYTMDFEIKGKMICDVPQKSILCMECFSLHDSGETMDYNLDEVRKRK